MGVNPFLPSPDIQSLAFTNSVDPDQLAYEDWSESALFAI